MNALASGRLLPALAAFVIAAVLLWLGTEILSAARRRTGAPRQRLIAAAVMLIGCGLWWPGHFLDPGHGAGATPTGIPLAAGLLALVLAAAALASAESASRRAWPALAACSLGTLFVAYGHAMFATPALFRAVRIRIDEPAG